MWVRDFLFTTKAVGVTPSDSSVKNAFSRACTISETRTATNLLWILVFITCISGSKSIYMPVFESAWRVMEERFSVWEIKVYGSCTIFVCASISLMFIRYIIQHVPCLKKYKLVSEFGLLSPLQFLWEIPLVLAVLLYFLLKAETTPHDYDSMSSFLNLSWRISLSFLIEDAWHYLVHRIAKKPFPILIAGFVIGGGFFIPCLLFANHVVFPWAWLIARLAQNADVHCGYDFPFNPLKLIPGYAGARFNSFHRKHSGYLHTFTFNWLEFLCSHDTRLCEHNRRLRQEAAEVIAQAVDSRQFNGAALKTQHDAQNTSGPKNVPFRACLITGSEGMVGSRLVSLLAERGAKRIVCVDIMDGPSPQFKARAAACGKLGATLEYVRADISSRDAIMSAKLFAGVEVVFHVAALVGPFHKHQLYMEVNFKGTHNVLDGLCKHGGGEGGGRVVFVDCSSPSTRFDGGDIRGAMEQELGYCFTGHEYARTKALAEKAVLDANGRATEQGGTLATCAVAPHQVYGPTDRLFLPAMLKTAQTGRLRVFGEGQNMVSFTHVDNICHGLILAGAQLWEEGHEAGAAGEFFVVTDGGARCFWDVVNDAVMKCGFPGLYSKAHLPVWLLAFVAKIGQVYTFLTGKFVKLTPFTLRMLLIDRVFCISKARAVLGYEPIVRFEDGWDATVRAVRKRVFGEQAGGDPSGASTKDDGLTNAWEAPTLSKRQGERFYLVWSAMWMTFFGGIVVTGAYEQFDEWSYMYVGFIVGGPCVVLPLLFPSLCDDPSLPVASRYTTKCAVWIGVLSWVGNYFWTHYFYNVLGAGYTFPAHRLNDVPFCLFLITQSYFVSYHTFSNFVLRRLRRATGGSYIVAAVAICIMSYFVAFMETLTISSFPYYTHADKGAMYKVGSVFYAIYFIVSFPMFLRVDEDNGDKGACWSLWQTSMEALASCMVVTQLLDFWRLYVGSIVSTEADAQTVIGAL